MANYSVSATFGAIDNISNIVGNIGKNVASMADSGLKSLESMAGGFGGLGNFAVGALGPLIGLGAQLIDQMEAEGQAMASFQATTDASAAVVASFKTESENLMGTGLVDNIKDATAIIGEMRRQIQDIAPDSNYSIGQFSANIAGIAKAWDTSGVKMVDDIADIMNKFDDLAGKPDLVADSLVRMAQVTGEPIDSLSKAVVKIGNQLAATGLSGFGAMSLIAMAANNGVTNFGPLGTAIDKFYQQMINPPAGFNAAIRALSLEDVVKKAKEGSISMDETLEIIFTKLDKIQDPAKRAQLAVELFGKGADKAFGDNIGKMAGFTNALGEVAGASDKVAKIMEDDGTLGTAIKHFGANFQVQVEQGLQRWYEMITKTDWAAIWHAVAVNITPALDQIAGAIQGIVDKVNSWISSIKTAIGLSTGGIEKTHPGDNLKMNALGTASMSEGWNVVGDAGPELLFKRGGNVSVYSNQQSQRMVQGSGAASGGSGAQVNITGNTFVGTGGLGDLARILTPHLQAEDQRRGLRN